MQTQKAIADKEKKLERMLKPYAAKLQKPKVINVSDASMSAQVSSEQRNVVRRQV